MSLSSMFRDLTAIESKIAVSVFPPTIKSILNMGLLEDSVATKSVEAE